MWHRLYQKLKKCNRHPQMMVGKQWVKRWGMYRWAGEASI